MLLWFDTVLAEGHSDIGPAAAAGSGATAAAEYFTASHTIIYCMLAYHNFLKTLTIYPYYWLTVSRPATVPCFKILDLKYTWVLLLPGASAAAAAVCGGW